ISRFCYFTDFNYNYKSDSSSTNLDSSLIALSTSDSQTETSLIAPCCLSIVAAITPEASWAAIWATRSVSIRRAPVLSKLHIRFTISQSRRGRLAAGGGGEG